jgi:hypothetical protein
MARLADGAAERGQLTQHDHSAIDRYLAMGREHLQV